MSGEHELRRDIAALSAMVKQLEAAAEYDEIDDVLKGTDCVGLQRDIVNRRAKLIKLKAYGDGNLRLEFGEDNPVTGRTEFASGKLRERVLAWLTQHLDGGTALAVADALQADEDDVTAVLLALQSEQQVTAKAYADGADISPMVYRLAHSLPAVLRDFIAAHPGIRHADVLAAPCLSGWFETEVVNELSRAYDDGDLLAVERAVDEGGHGGLGQVLRYAAIDDDLGQHPYDLLEQILRAVGPGFSSEDLSTLFEGRWGMEAIRAAIDALVTAGLVLAADEDDDPITHYTLAPAPEVTADPLAGIVSSEVRAVRELLGAQQHSMGLTANAIDAALDEDDPFRGLLGEDAMVAVLDAMVAAGALDLVGSVYKLRPAPADHGCVDSSCEAPFDEAEHMANLAEAEAEEAEAAARAEAEASASQSDAEEADRAYAQWEADQAAAEAA